MPLLTSSTEVPKRVLPSSIASFTSLIEYDSYPPNTLTPNLAAPSAAGGQNAGNTPNATRARQTRNRSMRVLLRPENSKRGFDLRGRPGPLYPDPIIRLRYAL